MQGLCHSWAASCNANMLIWFQGSLLLAVLSLEWKSVCVFACNILTLWEVCIVTALFVDRYYGYRVHGWNWLMSHTWADTCRCLETHTFCILAYKCMCVCACQARDLFCLSKAWLLQMGLNCWRNHRQASTEWPTNTLCIQPSHTQTQQEKRCTL